MSARRVMELHIEGLVLDGFSSIDHARVGEAMREEVAVLLSERGLHWEPAEPLEIAHLDGGTVRMREGFTAKALGRYVAQTLLRSVFSVARPIGHGENDARSGSLKAPGSGQVGTHP